jgi:hypothetical protein
VTRNGQVLIPNLPVVPDLAGATLEMQRETGFADKGWFLTTTITFAPGTSSRADSAYCILLDTDGNPGTGNPGSGPDASSFGWDHAVCAPDPRGQGAIVYRPRRPGQPGILDLSPSPGTIGSVVDGPLGPVEALGGLFHESPTTDQRRFTVGGLGLESSFRFKIISMQWVDAPVVLTGVVDSMPDVGAPPGLVR